MRPWADAVRRPRLRSELGYEQAGSAVSLTFAIPQTALILLGAAAGWFANRRIALALTGDARAADPVCALSPLHHLVERARDPKGGEPARSRKLEYRTPA